MKKIKENKYIVIALLILLTSMIINMINSYSNKYNLLIMITSTLIDTVMLYAYLLLPSKPIDVNLCIIIRQILIIIQDITAGVSIGDAITNEGIILLIAMVMMYINIKLAKINGSNAKERINNIIKYTREPIKIKLWIHIIIYGIFITVLMSLTNSEVLNMLNKDNGIRLFGALAIVLPTFEILAILTTSIISYEIILIYEIIKMYTIYTLYIKNGLNIQTFLYAILQLIVIIISIVMYRKSNKSKKEKVKNDK